MWEQVRTSVCATNVHNLAAVIILNGCGLTVFLTWECRDRETIGGHGFLGWAACAGLTITVP